MDTSNIEQVKAWLNQIAELQACIDNMQDVEIEAKIYTLGGEEIFMPGITLATTDSLFGSNTTDFRNAIISTMGTKIGELETQIAETPCDAP